MPRFAQRPANAQPDVHLGAKQEVETHYNTPPPTYSHTPAPGPAGFIKEMCRVPHSVFHILRMSLLEYASALIQLLCTCRPQVRRKINAISESWTPEQKQHCLGETEESFKVCGALGSRLLHICFYAHYMPSCPLPIWLFPSGVAKGASASSCLPLAHHCFPYSHSHMHVVCCGVVGTRHGLTLAQLRMVSDVDS